MSMATVMRPTPPGTGVMARARFEARLPRGRAFFRVTFFLPNVVSLAVVGVLWSQLYNPLTGPLNLVMRQVGLGGLARLWLGDPA